MAKCKCAPFHNNLISDTDTIFTKDKHEENVLKRKVFVFIFVLNFSAKYNITYP